MTAYYNECDPYAAQWLRNLIDAGHIAKGDVDERSITEVQADELRNYTQCHFFAGIGVWSLAARRAGIPDDVRFWTGSCPCQPFSAAGSNKRFDDERHLWPVWFDLIRQRRPAIVFGEQVANALDWIDLVSSDLEGQAYAFGAANLSAAGFGGAHIRQRMYFVGMADDDNEGSQGWLSRREDSQRQTVNRHAGRDCADHRMADTASRQPSERQAITSGQHRLFEESERISRERGSGTQSAVNVSRGLATDTPRLGGKRVDWLMCRDGKWRPIESGLEPLAYEATARVGRLRAYGNALDAETATQFMSAAMEAGQCLR